MSGPGPEVTKEEKTTSGPSKGTGGDAKAGGGLGSKTSQIARTESAGKGVDGAAAAVKPGGSVEKGLEAFPSIPGLDLDHTVNLARSAARNAVAIGTALAEAKAAFDPNEALSALYRAEAAALSGATCVIALNEAIPGGMKETISKLGNSENIPPKLTAALRALRAATTNAAAQAAGANIRQFGLLESAALLMSGRIKSMGSAEARVKSAIQTFSETLGAAGTPLASLAQAVSALGSRGAEAEKAAIRKRNADARARKEGRDPEAETAAKELAAKEPVAIEPVSKEAATQEPAGKEPTTKPKAEEPLSGGETILRGGNVAEIGQLFTFRPTIVKGQISQVFLKYTKGRATITLPIDKLPETLHNQGQEAYDASRTQMWQKVLEAAQAEFGDQKFSQVNLEAAFDSMFNTAVEKINAAPNLGNSM